MVTRRNVNANDLKWYSEDISKTTNLIKDFTLTVHRNVRGLPLLSVIKSKKDYDLLFRRVYSVLDILCKYYPQYKVTCTPLKKKDISRLKQLEAKQRVPKLVEIIYNKETGLEVHEKYKKYMVIKLEEVNEGEDAEIGIVKSSWDVVINEREHLKITTDARKGFEMEFHQLHKLMSYITKALKREDSELSIWRDDALGYIAVDPRNIGSLFECEFDLKFGNTIHYSSTEVIEYLRTEFGQTVNFNITFKSKDIHTFKLSYQPDLSEVDCLNKFKPIFYVMIQLHIHASTQTKLVQMMNLSDFLEGCMDMGNMAALFQNRKYLSYKPSQEPSGLSK